MKNKNKKIKWNCWVLGLKKREPERRLGSSGKRRVAMEWSEEMTWSTCLAFFIADITSATLLTTLASNSFFSIVSGSIALYVSARIKVISDKIAWFDLHVLTLLSHANGAGWGRELHSLLHSWFSYTYPLPFSYLTGWEIELHPRSRPVSSSSALNNFFK